MSHKRSNTLKKVQHRCKHGCKVSELPASSHIEAQTSLVKLEVRDGFSKIRQIEEYSDEPQAVEHVEERLAQMQARVQSFRWILVSTYFFLLLGCFRGLKRVASP